ncbi:hypothetical protein [Nannocystis exedens]|nr:hypothetical protein [Nannocystis exedens]
MSSTRPVTPTGRRRLRRPTRKTSLHPQDRWHGVVAAATEIIFVPDFTND